MWMWNGMVSWRYTAHEHTDEGEENDDEEIRMAVGIVSGGTTCDYQYFSVLFSVNVISPWSAF
jgi:hypothetical protein